MRCVPCVRRCQLRTADMYFAIVLALIGRPDGRHIANHTAKSISSISASSFSSSDDAAVKRVTGLLCLPYTRYFSHHRTPGELAPPLPSATAASNSFWRRELRSEADVVDAFAIASRSATVW